MLLQKDAGFEKVEINTCELFRQTTVQNILSSRVLSKNLKFRIYKTIILPVVLYGCETWSLTLREELDWKCLKTGC
jgi:hypothetical protein